MSDLDVRPPFDEIHRSFEFWAARQPEAIAVTYDGHAVSYGHLNTKANLLAHHLIDLNIGPGCLAPLCVERSIEMIVGILGIMKAGAAYVPIEPAYPRKRLAFILEDTKASILLTQKRFLGDLPEGRHQIVCLDAYNPKIIEHKRFSNPVTRIDPDSICYVIYTSGSTGQPKGVLICHRNVTRLFDQTQPWYQINENDVWAMFHSYAFDFSVWEIFGALLYGGRLAIVPRWMTQSPDALWEFLGREMVTVLNQTPASFLNLMRVDQVLEVENDHSSLNLIIFGGDALDPVALHPWFRKYGDDRPLLVNMYGITETTVHVTYYPLSIQDTEGIGVSLIGEPIPDLRVYILDMQMNLAPQGVEGELYVGGAGVAHGYLNLPELAAERFVPDPFSQKPGDRVYRSGDRARYRSNGVIEYLGRADRQVKIRGYRIEPAEIESLLTLHPLVREAVVVVREKADGDKRLIGYIAPQATTNDQPRESAIPVTNQSAQPQTSRSKNGVGKESSYADRVDLLRGFLGERLPDYMIPSAFVFLEKLPLTMNGKVDRKGLPEPLEAAAPDERRELRTPVEEIVAGVFAEVLGLDEVGLHGDFFKMGGHSLLATQVISRLRQALSVEASLRALFESPTVAGLAAVLERERNLRHNVQYPPITPTSRERESPLSYAQQQLWFIQQLEPESAAYNIPVAVRLQGTLDLTALLQALREVERRHEALRTRFETRDGRPVQVIDAPGRIDPPIWEMSELEDATQEHLTREIARQDAGRPFKLDVGPVWKAALARLKAEDYLLLLTMHHIVSDAWSMEVLVKEITILYRAFARGSSSPLPELEIQYPDFAIWQREWMKGEAMNEQIDRLERHLKDLPMLELPTLRPFPAAVSNDSARVPFRISPELTQGLKELSRREGVTMFMLLLAAFKTLLHNYTSQEDIVVGTNVANRQQVEIEGLIGFFVNMVVLRTDCSGDPPFRELLQRIREVSLQSYQNQNVPFEKVVDRLQPERSLHHSPLFQVVFSFRDAPGLSQYDQAITQTLRAPQMNSKGLSLSWQEMAEYTAKYHMVVNIHENERGLSGVVQYKSKLFDRSTIVNLTRHFDKLLSSIVVDPASHLSELEMLSEAELSLFDQVTMPDEIANNFVF